MIWLYYLLNLGFTILFLLPALSGIFFHIPLAKKLIVKHLINDEKAFIRIQWKRFFIFGTPYLLFTVISFYFLGIGALISIAIVCFICIGTNYKKIIGKHLSSAESFLTANAKYFKDQEVVIKVILEKDSQYT